jgi:hypothetical protein
LLPELLRESVNLVEAIHCYIGVFGGPLPTLGICQLGPERATKSVLKPCRRVSKLLEKLAERSETDTGAGEVPDLVQAVLAVRPWFCIILKHLGWREPLPRAENAELFPEHSLEPISSTPLDRFLWLVRAIETPLNRLTPRLDKLLMGAKEAARKKRRAPKQERKPQPPPKERISEWMPLKTAARRLGVGSTKKAVEKLSASLQDETADFWFQRLNRQTYRFDTNDFVK